MRLIWCILGFLRPGCARDQQRDNRPSIAPLILTDSPEIGLGGELRIFLYLDEVPLFLLGGQGGGDTRLFNLYLINGKKVRFVIGLGFVLLVLIDLGLILIDLIKITVEMSFSSPFMDTSTVVFGLELIFVNNEIGRPIKIVEDCVPPPAKVFDLDWIARPYRDKELGPCFNVDASENLLVFICDPVISSFITVLRVDFSSVSEVVLGILNPPPFYPCEFWEQWGRNRPDNQTAE